MVALTVHAIMTTLFGFIILHNELLQIYMMDYWTIKFVGNFGWGLRVATTQQSLTLTTLDFTFTQDRENLRTTDGWF